MVSGVFLPILVGLVTKQVASRNLKAVLLAFLSAVAGFISVVTQGSGVVTKEVVVAALVTWITAIAVHYGLWKPTGATEAVQEKTANIGIG